MTPQERAFREIDRTVEQANEFAAMTQAYIDRIHAALEADPEAKAIYEYALRESIEQQATDNFVERTRARRLARISEAEKRFGWGDR